MEKPGITTPSKPENPAPLGQRVTLSQIKSNIDL